MARRSGPIHRTLVLALLVVVLTTCRRETAEEAYRAARADADRNELSAASAKVDAAIARYGEAGGEWYWSLRILQGELLIKRQRSTIQAGRAIVNPPLPAPYARSEAAVRRLIALGIADVDASHFRDALALAEQHQPKLLAETHLALANVVPLQEAEAHYRAAMNFARAQGREIIAAHAYNALSRSYANASRFAEAIDAGEEALRRYDALGVQPRVSSAAGNLGWAYALVGDYQTAEELFARAAAAAEEAGLESERMRWLNQLGNVRLDDGDVAAADRYYEQALALAQSSEDRKSEAQFAANRARAVLALGKIELADQLNARALAIKKAEGEEESELISHIIQARIAASRGEHASAERTLRTVAAETKMQATRWEAQARLAQLHAAAGRRDEADAAFRGAIQTAGRARADRYGERDLDLRLSFFNLVAEIFDAYIAFLVDAGRIEDALAVTEQSRAQSLEEGLGLAHDDAQQRRLDPRAVARRANATILCYWLGRESAYLWVVTPEKVALHTLPPSRSIEAEVEAYRRDLAGLGGTIEESGARGSALHAMLVEPAGAFARDQRVIIIPDGRLYELNFETLVSGGRYWIEEVVISTASSLELLEGRGRTGAVDGSILLVGNAPAVDDYPRLEHAWTEIAGIKDHFSRYMALNHRAATPAAYVEARPERFEYVHFVAHGVASRKRPLESAVILARDEQGYKLYARDIVRQPLAARLVTVSSCYGAGTRTYAGEGLVGLAWAFLGAGAENVIAALWEVNDLTTPRLMEQMYAGLRAGRDPAAALRDAKLTLVRSHGVQRKPSYWAPFVLYGRS